MQLSAKELAQILDGKVEGNPEVLVNRPSKIEEGGVGTISFLGNLKYEPYAYTTTASILLVDLTFVPKSSIQATLIRVKDVYASVALLLEKFGQNNATDSGIAKEAFVHASAQLGKDVAVGRFSVIEADAIIGDNCQIADQVYVGKKVKLGNNVILHPGVKVLADCEIGDNCILQPNVIIGGDGFGFNRQADGSYNKIAQIGNVILEADVEVGANTTIDRATLGSTIIRKGVKLDNLIQIAHNVEIGENTVVAAQAGIAGSTKIGKNCLIGGQVGFVGHIKVADGAQIQAQSGIASPIKEENAKLFGSPAIEYGNYVRSYAVFKQLPALFKKIRELEKLLQQK